MKKLIENPRRQHELLTAGVAFNKNQLTHTSQILSRIYLTVLQIMDTNMTNQQYIWGICKKNTCLK